MRLRTGGLVLCVLGVAAAGGWWWLSGRAPRANVVLITLDTTRADRLGCYGYATAATPNLDRLAADSLQFDRAYTAVPITLPSHATLHTGLLPPEHGLRINGVSRLSDDVPTLAELLQTEGYRTGAFVSSLVLDERFGLGQGFEEYDDALTSVERSAADTISSAVAWLKGVAAEPVFCWVHLYDPHEPYDPHTDEFGGRFTESPYDGEIAYMDQHIGRLLSALTELGIDDRTLIVVAGDHGEGLGQHAESTHGYLAYNSTMHVPLLIRRTGNKPPGDRLSDPVSLADVFPTLLDELGIAVPEHVTGHNLVAPVQSNASQERAFYGETDAPYLEGGWSPLRTWTTAQWKYIESTRPELYDLAADPDETRNLIDQQLDQATQLQQALVEFEATLTRRQGAAAATTAEDVKALRTLGYAGGQAPAGGSDKPLRDIKDTLQYAEQVHQCMHLIDLQKPQEAQHILEEVVAAVPDYPKAWGTLGVCLAVQEDYQGAETHYRKALELDANQNFARIGLGRALFALERLEECADELQQAVEVEPSALDAQYYLGEACRRLKRRDESRRALEAAVAIDPEFADAHVALADLSRDEGRLEEAAEQYELVLQLNPQLLDAVVSLSDILPQLDRTGEAIQTLDAVVQRSPKHVAALTQLALLLATAKNPALRDPARGVRLAEEACLLTSRKSAAPLRALAAAQAADGKRDAAIKTAEEALAVVSESEAVLVPEIERELERYRAP